MTPHITRDVIEIMISKRKYFHAIGMMYSLPKDEKNELIRKILNHLLDKNVMLIDEARAVAVYLPKLEKNEWIKKIADIQAENFLFDDARYTAGQMSDLDKTKYISALFKKGINAPKADRERYKDTDTLIKKYLSMGMFKRALKISKDLPEYKRTAYLTSLPAEKKVKNQKDKSDS
ncbi:MAG: hypothetical protein US50_C0012G0012 [Candidatus Nomurabacteria bacterium GW2011_GWB1_37_5]|uniref:Uncharacterized protein n=1 Tax=Candidatus Nomurabacteria bacterium GW2011_GWB1_37_5 TaxID=1618742 RepID=A0A0G0GZX0_9BACT|nr:MAG: hypothetical protein US50_C0012G0012 [Candidatus Nomurabacteria bacterium GW2011_GWB1_37_5]